MHLSTLLLRSFRILLPVAIVATLYLYLYPAFQQCAFPDAKDGKQAPFRLLTLADPQLEGDTSLPNPEASLLPRVHSLWDDLKHKSWDRGGHGRLRLSLRQHGSRLLSHDIPRIMKSYRKQLDLWGNDRYLAHIYRLMHWWSDPSHVVVLGDLLGSQWISDEEFARRTDRFWRTVFSNGKKVGNEITANVSREVLGADKLWKHRIIAVAGNHDIGYAGDITKERVARFEKAYGSVNWEVRFALNASDDSPELRLTVLNSMNLDGPAYDDDLRTESLEFLNLRLRQTYASSRIATILLTHIPLYKDHGICVDGPFVDHFPQEYGGGIREQNHLAYNTSQCILDALVGEERRDRKALILNGHDHEGCQVYHALSSPNAKDSSSVEVLEQPSWTAYPSNPHKGALKQNRGFVGVREITVRSMMGDFDGNAGLVSAWWDDDSNQWAFDYASCEAGVQHIWWAVHAVDLAVLGVGLAGLLVLALESFSAQKKTDAHKKNV